MYESRGAPSEHSLLGSLFRVMGQLLTIITRVASSARGSWGFLETNKMTTIMFKHVLGLAKPTT
jgi:hypothetical protein